MAIQQLEIRGFRSLQDVTWKPGALNVLIGPNGAGKSNLLRVLVLIKRAAEGKLSETIKDMDGITALLWDGRAKEIELRLLAVPSNDLDKYPWSTLDYELHLDPMGRSSAFRVERETLVNFHRPDDDGVVKFIERTPGRTIMWNQEKKGLESKAELYNGAETLFRRVVAGLMMSSIISVAVSTSHTVGEAATCAKSGRVYSASFLPKTAITWPLHQSDRSLARYATAGATLSGDMNGSESSSPRPSSGMEPVIRVIAAGEIAFAVTP